jgi:hypothetical protein
LIQAERVDDVVDFHGFILNTLLCLLSRCIGSSICNPISVWLVLFRGWFVLTDFDGTKRDHGTIDFIDDIIDFLQIVGVRDDLVTGDNILHRSAELVFESPTFCTSR